MRSTEFQHSSHLADEELEPPHQGCPFCGSNDRSPEFLIQDDPDVHLLTCRQCKAASVSRMPTAEALKSYYADYYRHKDATNDDHDVTFDKPRRLATRIVDFAFPPGSVPETVRLLDFGGGDGSIAVMVADACKKKGALRVEIALVDYGAGAVPPGDSDISLTKYGKLEELGPDKIFDLVIASAIIEHLPRPADALKNLLERVAAGGTFYARTPFVSPFGRIAEKLGKRWDFTFPGHLHDLGERFWSVFFTRPPYKDEFDVAISRPSIVETTLDRHLVRTILAHIFKLPWLVLRSAWPFVGGWEIAVRRKSRVHT